MALTRFGLTFFSKIAATHGKNQQTVPGAQATAFEPFGKNRRPAVIVGPRGQFGNIVGGRVSLKTADLPKIIHSMSGITRAAADTEDEQSSAAFAHPRQFIGGLFNRIGVQLGDNLLDFIEELFGKAHGAFDCNSDSSSAKPAGEPIS